MTVDELPRTSTGADSIELAERKNSGDVGPTPTRDFVDESGNGVVKRVNFLMLGSQATNCNRTVVDFTLADGHQHRDFGDAVFAYLVGNFFVAQVGVRADACIAQLGDDVKRVIVGVRSDGQHHDLHWCEP